MSHAPLPHRSSISIFSLEESTDKNAVVVFFLSTLSLREVSPLFLPLARLDKKKIFIFHIYYCISFKAICVCLFGHGKTKRCCVLLCSLNILMVYRDRRKPAA